MTSALLSLYFLLCLHSFADVAQGDVYSGGNDFKFSSVICVAYDHCMCINDLLRI